MRALKSKLSGRTAPSLTFARVCLLILCNASLALATGMVTGRVTDKKNGELATGSKRCGQGN